MYKDLRNEAIYRFQIQTDAPFVIKSGEADILDPTLPDSQVVRSYRRGESHVVIPGSTLKGIFRSRAEQLLQTMGHSVNPFKTLKREKDETSQSLYVRSDLAQRLFGSTAMKGRIQFQDAFPAGGTEVVMGLRHGVGINRITGGAETGKKFETEVVEEAVFQVEVRLVNYELWQLALIAWLIQDLHDGYIKIGSYTTRGFGRFLVNDVSLQVTDYRPEVKWLTGYEATDRIGSPIEWKRTLLKKEVTYSTLHELIGEQGVLNDVHFPKPKQGV